VSTDPSVTLLGLRGILVMSALPVVVKARGEEANQRKGDDERARELGGTIWQGRTEWGLLSQQPTGAA